VAQERKSQLLSLICENSNKSLHSLNLCSRAAPRRYFDAKSKLQATLSLQPASHEQLNQMASQPLTTMFVRQDLLDCLRWNILENPQETKIMSGINEHGEQMHIPLLEHPIARQSLVQPPQNRVEILSQDALDARECTAREPGRIPEDFEFTNFFEYTSLVIEHEDGSPVTVGEFVVQVHEHMNKFKDVITHSKDRDFWLEVGKKSKDNESNDQEDLQQGLKVWFKEAESKTLEGRVCIVVSTDFEGEDGRPIHISAQRIKYTFDKRHSSGSLGYMGDYLQFT
jgi:hypothetical protein